MLYFEKRAKYIYRPFKQHSPAFLSQLVVEGRLFFRKVVEEPVRPSLPPTGVDCRVDSVGLGG